MSAEAARRNAILMAENEALRERVAQLEEALFAGWKAPVEWRLSPLEERVMGVLIGRAHASRATIMTALYGLDPNGGAQDKIINVLICHIRRKLTPFGVRILTDWGRGWSLHAEDRAALSQNMARSA